jgi:hemoglobin-like flavoprotein
MIETNNMQTRNSKIGDIVIKQYGDRTVVSKYPDMSNIIPSDSQKQKRSRFAEAVAYAKTINNSAILRNDLIKRVGGVKSVYQCALKEFLHREN